MAIKVHSISITIASGAALSAAFSMEEFNQGQLAMPAAWTAADIGFQISDSYGGTYQPLYNASGLVVISGPTANNTYLLPADIAAARFVKLWSNTGGSGTNQAADRVIRVDLKAV